MVNYIVKYKYLILSTFARFYLFIIFHDEHSYIQCVYQLNFNFFDLIVGLGLTILDILYMVHYVLKTYNLKYQMIIRTYKTGYMLFVLKNICWSLLSFICIQSILQIFFYHHLTYHLFIYSGVLMVSNFIIFKFNNESLYNYLIILSLIINTFMKVFY